jgi:hypothetical protein
MKSTNYNPKIQQLMLILGKEGANYHFSGGGGWKGDMWPIVVFIITMLQKPKESFCEMEEGKKKNLFVGFIDSHFRF